VTFAVIIVFVAVAGGAYYIGLGIMRNRSSARLVSLQQTRDDIMGTSFAERAVAPMFDRLGGWALRFTPVGWGTRTEHRLLLAGWEDRFDRTSWAAVRLLSIAGSLVAWLILQSFLSGFWARLIVFGLLVFFGIFLPGGVLTRRVDQRRDAMRKELPDILDLLDVGDVDLLVAQGGAGFLRGVRVHDPGGRVTVPVDGLVLVDRHLRTRPAG